MPRIDLTVPFAEKDEAKRLGARWDGERKLWYVPDVVYGKWSGGTQVTLHSNEAKEFVKTATGSNYEVMNLSNDDPLLSMILLKFPKDGA